MKANAFGMLLSVALVALTPGTQAQQTAEGAAEGSGAVAGLWEGPWYRGMTSGKVQLQVEGGGGTIRFTNLDKFGDAAHLLTNTSMDGRAFQFRSEGEAGGPLTATLKLNEAGTEMKGLGRFDGFPLRFEVKRVPR
jgi:hypothetical protein